MSVSSPQERPVARVFGDPAGLPHLICQGHALSTMDGTPAHHGLLARVYLLVTRVLTKLDDQQLGWMAADRARTLAALCGDPLAAAEAARNLAVLARKAGWHAQATTIALTAAEDPDLRGDNPVAVAERGLLIQSAAYTAAYTAARTGDRHQMRELTDQAAAIAATLPGGLLRDHGGGFTPATVTLHRISAENWAGDPDAAITAARTVRPHTLPTIERQARYFTDLATALHHRGRRDECIGALLAAEHHAPEETHTRPAIRNLTRELLTSGRTTSELRGLAIRSGIR